MSFVRINVVLLTSLLYQFASANSNLITYKLSIPDGVKALLGYPGDNLLDFTQIATKYGYKSERYSVVTEDGYILKLHTMRSRHCKKFIQPPVLLMHGLLLSSDAWLDAGPNVTLAYLLADHCFDLWVGNVRGNYLGREHVRLNPDRDAEFWNFSFDEMGLYDAPALVDFVLKSTKSEKLNYMGYSQGGGMFVIMCSERPGYCDKVNTFIGLAPATRMLNTRSLLFRGVLQLVESFSNILSTIGIQELTFKGSILQEALEFICKNRAASAFCEAVIAIADGYDPGSLHERTLTRLYAHFNAGSSMKNFVKYAQSFRSDTFHKFDYGPVKNIKIYGTEAPPDYDLSKVNIPLLIIQGINDHIVDVKDSIWLQDRLPNAELKIIDNPLWTHFDVIYSSFGPKLMFPSVLKQLLKYSDMNYYNITITPELLSTKTNLKQLPNYSYERSENRRKFGEFFKEMFTKFLGKI